MLANQASVFNGSCNIYAPEYRQATYYSFFQTTPMVLMLLMLHIAMLKQHLIFILIILIKANLFLSMDIAKARYMVKG